MASFITWPPSLAYVAQCRRIKRFDATRHQGAECFLGMIPATFPQQDQIVAHGLVYYMYLRCPPKGNTFFGDTPEHEAKDWNDQVQPNWQPARSDQRSRSRTAAIRAGLSTIDFGNQQKKRDRLIHHPPTTNESEFKSQRADGIRHQPPNQSVSVGNFAYSR